MAKRSRGGEDIHSPRTVDELQPILFIASVSSCKSLNCFFESLCFENKRKYRTLYKYACTTRRGRQGKPWRRVGFCDPPAAAAALLPLPPLPPLPVFLSPPCDVDRKGHFGGIQKGDCGRESLKKNLENEVAVNKKDTQIFCCRRLKLLACGPPEVNCLLTACLFLFECILSYTIEYSK